MCGIKPYHHFSYCSDTSASVSQRTGYYRVTEEVVPLASIRVPGKKIHAVASEQENFQLQYSADSLAGMIVTAAGFKDAIIPFKNIKTFFEVELEPRDSNLQEIVISGTLKEVRKSNSPVPVETYSAKFFKKNASSNLFEALSVINGVQPQLNCNVYNFNFLPHNPILRAEDPFDKNINDPVNNPQWLYI